MESGKGEHEIDDEKKLGEDKMVKGVCCGD